MQTSISPIVLVAIASGILALIAIVVAFRMRPARQSGVALTAAVLPALLMLALFYSLAIHMHQRLGAWPNSIGDAGFPAPLITHDSIASNYFIGWLLVSILAWPIAFLLCVVIKRWRVCLYYMGVYALACLVCLGAMMLAPSQFLNWWWD